MADLTEEMESTLAYIAQDGGVDDEGEYVDGRTVNALKRRGLVEDRKRGGGYKLTAAGRRVIKQAA